MGIIYSITNPKGRLYVGKTYDLRKRINCHKCASKKGTKIILHNSIKKYGWDNHLLQIIEDIPEEKLNEREIFWIATLKTYCYENKMGMNMTRGGEGQRSTWMHDIERRKKMSERFSGKNNPGFGKQISNEAKKILSEKATKRHLERGTKIPEWGVEKMLELCSKKVLAYDINGDFIKEFKSNSEAGRFFNIHTSYVSCVARGEQLHTNSIIFRNYTENYPLQIDVSGIEVRKVNRPILRLNHSKNVIKEYSDAREAAIELNVPKTTISRAAQYNKGKPIRTGYIFVYKDEYELNQVINN